MSLGCDRDSYRGFSRPGAIPNTKVRPQRPRCSRVFYPYGSRHLQLLALVILSSRMSYVRTWSPRPFHPLFSLSRESENTASGTFHASAEKTGISETCAQVFHNSAKVESSPQVRFRTPESLIPAMGRTRATSRSHTRNTKLRIVLKVATLDSGICED